MFPNSTIMAEKDELKIKIAMLNKEYYHTMKILEESVFGLSSLDPRVREIKDEYFMTVGELEHGETNLATLDKYMDRYAEFHKLIEKRLNSLNQEKLIYRFRGMKLVLENVENKLIVVLEELDDNGFGTADRIGMVDEIFAADDNKRDIKRRYNDPNYTELESLVKVRGKKAIKVLNNITK